MKNRATKIAVLALALALVFGTLIVSAILYTEDSGMKFDGLAEYKTASVEMPLPETYEATIRFPKDYSGIGGVIYGSYADDKTAGFKLEVISGGAPRLYIIASDGAKYDFTFNKVNLYNGETTHLAIVLDRAAGSAVCYINGEVAEALKATLPASFNITSVFALGGDTVPGNYSYFRGGLFNLSLYEDKRSADEISFDVSSGKIDESGLIAAYTNLGEGGKSITATGSSSYNLTYKCEWVADAKAPEGYDYSFAVIGDIQSMTYYYPDKLVEQFEWLRDNAKENKLAYVVGLGDITEKNTAAEYQKVVEAYDKIDGVVPFSIIRGNHDRTSANDTTLYDTYISYDKYGDEITGSYDGTMQNTYRILQVGNVKYMFMNLDLTLTDGAIAWANDVIAAHPECHVIVSTHIYKNMSGTYLVLDGKFGAENNPEDLWNDLLSQHENIVMVLYGHSPKDKLYKKQREGVNGNIVTEMLINPSETDKVYGGGGFVAMFYFSENGEQLDVRYYSTAKEAYYLADNQFALTLDTPGVVEFSDVIMNVGSNESERNITWYSRSSINGEIRYAKSTNGKLPASYETVDAIAVKASKPGYYTYKATMTGLEPNSTYVYQLVIGDVSSECYSFKTYGMGDDFSFAFITDPQLKQESHGQLWDDTLEKIQSSFGGVSIIVSGGDQTSDPASENNFEWFASDHLSSIAIATTVGPPHDNTLLYKDHYNLPNLSSNYGISTPSSDYFYTYGNVLFMHLNVENHDYDGHISFVENAIADNPDCLWRVVVLHYSFFSGGNHSTDASVINFRTAVAGRFSQLGIDLVLSGHDHVYARSRMMTDGYTVSSDVVTNGSVTDPTGTLYICGTSSTGSGWYSVEHHDDDAYIAFSEDTNRKSVVIFSVTEGSLTLKSYFINGSTPEEFDSFTIYKSKDTVRLNKDTNKLEILSGSARVPLVDAYAYTSATLKVVGGYWALSTDGVSFSSIGVASSDSTHQLRINESTGYWELSSDGGKSFESLEINSRTYTVKYVTMPGTAFGDGTDLSAYSARRYTAASPDAPVPNMPKGSMREGNLYDWSWEYYLVGGNGKAVSTFEYGKSYVAYPVASATPIASTIYISTESNPDEYTYTWLEAWDIVLRCAGEEMTLVLKSDLTLTALDAISVVAPIDLTLDLGGKRLNTSAVGPAVKLAVGSNGSIFSVVTSSKNGTLYAGSNDFLEIGPNQGSTVTVKYGSPDTEPLCVESVRYLVGANGNFKYASTLNLDIYGGSYTVTRSLIYISNVSANATKNIYKLSLEGATFNFAGTDSAITRAKSTTGYYAAESSYINAVGCSFIDSGTTAHTASRAIIREDVWYGAMSFADCDFIGMSIGTDKGGAALTVCGSITVGDGCTFTNSKTSFTTTENLLSFFSDKVAMADGCVLARTDANGGAAVVSGSDAAEITWSNPVGYKEHWVRGSIPAYLGPTSFSVNGTAYSLVLAEAPVAASGSKAYAFVSEEGYLYRYDDASGAWQISMDGGKTYTDITEGGYTPDTPETPDPEVGCTVDIDGNVTTYAPDTDFSTVLSAVGTSANAGKTVRITLGSDMSFNTGLTFSKNMTVEIDLAGYKLSYNADSRLKTGSGYTLHFYSSKAGGELAFASGEGISTGTGTVIFGSEEYKNNLTVTTTGEILNPSQTSSGATLRYVFLYCTVNAKTFNLMRINAKGAGTITLKVEIEGCNITGTGSLICYNYTSTLGATSNGGICAVDSYIVAKDSTFSTSSETPIGFFGSPNFADRYFGTVLFEGCTFKNYVLNGEIILSDEALDYNGYYDTLTDYDPTKAITVGEGCVFYGYGATFKDDMSGFMSSNVSLADGCSIMISGDCVTISSESLGCKVEIDGETVSYPKDTDLKEILAIYNSSSYSGKEIRITLEADMSILGTINLSSIKNYTLIIDLAGHKLTLNAGGRVRFGGVFAVNIYSSAEGGELAFATGDDGIQIDGSGTLIFGSEQYKNTLTVNAVKELVNVAQIADGSTLTVKYLYATVNAKSYGILRLNAKGAGCVTLLAEVKGCTVNGTAAIINYNSSSSLSATANGGVYGVDSYIRITDSVFNCAAESPAGFFGHANFTDRYFGKLLFEGCTFRNYYLNGELIYSDEALAYNTYFDTLTDYDPKGAITVGKNCLFYGSEGSFLSDMSGFAAGNTYVADGCNLVYTPGAVMILDATEHALSGWLSEYGQHWKECTTCADGVKFNLSACTVEDGACTVCGAAEDLPVTPPPAEGHTYAAVVTPPTCTDAGYTTYTCTECGESYVDSYVTALGHSYGEWTVTTPATCTEGGERSRECSVCGSVICEDIPALGHNNVEQAAKAPTCLAIGWEAYEKCSVCGATDGYTELPKADHAWVDATCETMNVCSVCGMTSGEPLGHTWEGGGCESARICSTCGKAEGEAPGHDWVDASCESPKTCSVCKKTEGDALGHDWVDATVEAPKSCTRCGATEGEKLPEDGDDITDEPADGGEQPPEDSPEIDHSQCKGSRFWNAIINFFRRLFGLPKKCVCGKEIL